MNMLLMLFFIFYGVLAYFRPKNALFFLLAVLPVYQIRFYVFLIPMTVLEGMILVLFVLYFIKNINEIKKILELLGMWKWLISAWLFVATISIFIAPDLRVASGIWKAYFIEPILLLFVFLALIKNKKDFKFAFASLVFSSFYLSLFVFYQKFTGQGVFSTEIWGMPKIWRATSLFLHPNFLGLYIGPIFVLGLGHIISHFRKNIWYISYSLLFFILLSLSLIFARSEGAILGVFAGLIFYGLFFKPTRRFTIIGLILVLLIIFILPISRDYVIEKGTFRDLSGQLRINIWKGTFSLIKQTPVLGVGLSGYQKLIPDYQKRYYHSETNELISVETHPYPHNLFLSMWVETGVVGLLLFILMIIMFFYNGFKNIEKEKIYILAIMSAMVVILVHGLVDTPYFKNDLSVLYWMIIGFMLFFRRGG